MCCYILLIGAMETGYQGLDLGLLNKWKFRIHHLLLGGFFFYDSYIEPVNSSTHFVACMQVPTGRVMHQQMGGGIRKVRLFCEAALRLS